MGLPETTVKHCKLEKGISTSDVPPLAGVTTRGRGHETSAQKETASGGNRSNAHGA